LTLSMTKSQEIPASIMFIGRWVIALLRFHLIPSHFRSLGCVITLMAVPPWRFAMFSVVCAFTRTLPHPFSVESLIRGFEHPNHIWTYCPSPGCMIQPIIIFAILNIQTSNTSVWSQFISLLKQGAFLLDLCKKELTPNIECKHRQDQVF